MLKVDYIGLPNLLLNKLAYPELIQSKCSAKEINLAMESYNKGSFSDEIKATLKGQGFHSVAQEILSLS
jgi:lipid A disaccharide synthetase